MQFRCRLSPRDATRHASRRATREVAVARPGCTFCSTFIFCRGETRRICFAATGKSEAVPDGNGAELLGEKAAPRWRAGGLDGGVAPFVVVVNPMSFKPN